MITSDTMKNRWQEDLEAIEAAAPFVADMLADLRDTLRTRNMDAAAHQIRKVLEAILTEFCLRNGLTVTPERGRSATLEDLAREALKSQGLRSKLADKHLRYVQELGNYGSHWQSSGRMVDTDISPMLSALRALEVELFPLSTSTTKPNQRRRRMPEAVANLNLLLMLSKGVPPAPNDEISAHLKTSTQKGAAYVAVGKLGFEKAHHLRPGATIAWYGNSALDEKLLATAEFLELVDVGDARVSGTNLPDIYRPDKKGHRLPPNCPGFVKVKNLTKRKV
jgi:hypothetical protein